MARVTDEFALYHKTGSLDTILCVFKVKGSVVEVGKVISLIVCAKSLPLLADL